MPEPHQTSEAWTCARAASGRAGVTIAELTSLDDALKVNRVIERVWGAQHLHRELIRAIQHAGGALVGAFDKEEMVGFALGFVGLSGGLHLHSHMAAVLPGMEHRGIGYALKLGQRAQCLDMGVEEVRWTYDPLVSRNGRFNLVKLGAVATEFLSDFYGEMDDLINQGDRSDRFEVVWRLRSARVERRLSEGLAFESEADSGVALLESVGDPDLPSPRATGASPAGVSLVAVPRDHGAIKAKDFALAGRWRSAVAEAVAACFAAGLVATWLTDECEYVFRELGPGE